MSPISPTSNAALVPDPSGDRGKAGARGADDPGGPPRRAAAGAASIMARASPERRAATGFGLRIRRARPADLPAVMAMKRALNEAEQVSEFPSCAAADWHRDVFGAARRFVVAVAECDGVIVGIATCSRRRITGWSGAILYLQDLFVAEGYRRRGIATRLLRHVAGHAVAHGMALIELNVRAENPARELYRRAGFEHAVQCLTYVIAGPRLLQLAGSAGDTSPR